jgi:peroxiredoxin
MSLKTAVASIVMAVGCSVLFLAQTTAPATRSGSIGKIVASAEEVVPLGKGATAPRLTLKTATGEPFDLNAWIGKQATVLIFYRGGWCPICMRQLSGMEGVIEELKDAGYQVIAVSPDKPAELARTIENDQLTFTLLSDSDATGIKAFGLAFQASPSQFEKLERYSGATHHALPVPAVYLLSTDGTIEFAHFDPDYKKRMTPSEVVAHAKAVLHK